MRERGTMAGRFAALVVAAAAWCAGQAPPSCAAERIPGSIAADPLVMPTEAFVLTREDLINYNVHTLEDILGLVPGVSWWRRGPAPAERGFSIEGRSGRGVNLLVNGEPIVDPYRLEAFTRFLPLSRLERVEVLYSGSPAFTSDLSSRGVVNLVIEEGGREAPTARLNFTYGKAKRRARRAWFATPRAHIGGVLAYEEYLQDGVECIPALPGRIVGKYDGRAVLAELLFDTTAGERVLVRFRRYEDTAVGTATSSREDVRWSGFATLVAYRRGALEASLRQQALLFSRRGSELRAFSFGGTARWTGSLGPLGVRGFATAESVEHENEVSGASFDPSWRRFEAGAAVGSRLPSGVTWRAGAWGGDHREVGRYAGGEIALAKEWSPRFSQDIVVARRLRVPSAEELYQPEIAFLSGGDTLSTAGSTGLSPEISDEISLGVRVPHLALSVFGRNETSRIVLAGGARSVYRSEGSGMAAGVRGRFGISRRMLGIDCRLIVGAEGYPEREALAPGVPGYRARAEVGLARRMFKETELLSIGFASEAVGTRSWPAAELPAYRVHDVNASLSIMSARVSFEFRNILDARYETVPGFRMPGRYYVIGVFWELFD